MFELCHDDVLGGCWDELIYIYIYICCIAIASRAFDKLGCIRLIALWLSQVHSGSFLQISMDRV